MPLRKLKYSSKVKVLFIPVFVLMGAGLLLVYNVASKSLKDEHHERLMRTARLTDDGFLMTEKEMMKMANLFQTNRTLKEYLYISTVLGGDRRPLRDMLQPLAASLDIDDLDLYDARGARVLNLDIMPEDDPKEESVAALAGGLPGKVMYGFTETSNTLKIVAVSPLKTGEGTVGYIAVGKYLNSAYLRELKEMSGNELFRVDKDGRTVLEGAQTRGVYAPWRGKLSLGNASYSVLEKKIVAINGEPLGMIIVALADRDLTASLRRLRLYMVGMLGIAAALSFILSALFIRTLVAPLNQITTFTGKVAQGELDEDLPVRGNDEVAALAGHFNDMKRQLKSQREVVLRYTGDLERAVEERTSELRKVQHQLLQSQKMEAVGQLAGGIAHDFNNFLTAIMGYAAIYQKKLRDDESLKKYADLIISTSKRASNLTRGLLTFSRKQVLDSRPVDVNGVVRNAEKILLRLIGEDVDLKTALPDKEMIVMADSGQIEQVLLNLATNARDAMPEGGCLLIETRTVQLDENFVQTNGWGRPGAFALLSVTDTGTGMDEATREKVFEPFFTTKEAGKGTGLGLSMVYGIIQQHDGFVNIYSEPDAGTAVKIYLPLVFHEAACILPEELVSHPLGGTETILVAEDNEAIRELTRSGLDEAGYTVIAAADGLEALEKFKTEKDRVHLLVLDVIMPKKNGKAVYEEIKRIKPDIKVLFTSGYSADFLHTKGVLESGIHLIKKPMTTDELLKKIRMVLDA